MKILIILNRDATGEPTIFGHSATVMELTIFLKRRTRQFCFSDGKWVESLTKTCTENVASGRLEKNLSRALSNARFQDSAERVIL